MSDAEVVDYMMAPGPSEVIRDLEMAPAPVIAKWQIYLQKFGYYKGAIDSIYGSGSRQAITRCSKDANCWTDKT